MADGPRPKPGSVFVPIGPVPRFRVLSDIDRRAERESQFLLDAALRQIKRVVRDAPEDPADDLIAAAAAVASGAPGAVEEFERSLRRLALSKSAGVFDPRERGLTREEAAGLQLIAHELRRRHGAPTRPAGLIDGDTVPPSPAGDRRADAAEAASRILGLLPFRSGRLVPDRNGAVRMRGERPEPLPDPHPIPMAVGAFLDEDVRSSDLRAVLRGDLDQVVRAVRHPTEEAFTVFEGAATWVAAELLGLPALEVELYEPAREGVERAAAPAEPPHDLHSDLRAAKAAAARFAYAVPPVLEPVAELARDLPMRTFLDAYAGRPGTEEIVARRRADLLNTSRDRSWMAIYKAARMSGLGQEESAGRATRSPEFRRANSTWRGAQRAAVRVEEAGDALRERFRLAKAGSLNLRRELGLSAEDPVVSDPAQLWFHARRGPDAFTEEELMDRVDPEQSDFRRESAGLPHNVSAPRFTNLGTDDGAPRLLLRPPPPRPDLGRDVPEEEAAVPAGPTLVVDDARIPFDDAEFAEPPSAADAAISETRG